MAIVGPNDLYDRAPMTRSAPSMDQVEVRPDGDGIPTWNELERVACIGAECRAAREAAARADLLAPAVGDPGR
jgi:hypothetical protein